MKESDIQRACLDLLTVKRIWHARWNNIPPYDPKRGAYRAFLGKKGMPDIVAILPVMAHDGVVGAFCGIEVKRLKGKQSEHQKATEEEICGAGGYYLLVHSADELEADLKELGF